MKFIKHIIKSFKNNPIKTILALIFDPIALLFVGAASLCLMISNLSVEEGLEWFKEVL